MNVQYLGTRHGQSRPAAFHVFSFIVWQSPEFHFMFSLYQGCLDLLLGGLWEASTSTEQGWLIDHRLGRAARLCPVA